MELEQKDRIKDRPRWPKSFLLRRFHSLTGAWIACYLLFHLFVNSQAVLSFADHGSSFCAFVNAIHRLPWLPVFEILLIGAPLLFHGALGIIYAIQSKLNSYPTDGRKPAIIHSAKNYAYTLQRLTAWILIVFISLHVVQMRFLLSPEKKVRAHESSYSLIVEENPWLLSAAKKIGVTLVEGENRGELVALSPKAGPLYFLEVCSLCKNLPMILIYSLFVSAATFHAMNGMWTFAITWGITLPRQSQQRMRRGVSLLMALFILISVGALFGLYFSMGS